MESHPIVLESGYYDKLWLTFVREWTRATTNQSVLDELDDRLRKGEKINVPDQTSKEIEDCLLAMSDGGNVVPGIWQDSDQKCYQDWTETACFARWYMQSNAEKKAKIVELLKSGNASPWDSVENGVSAISQCPPGKQAVPECCPSSVRADPAYINMDQVPEQKSGWSWWTLGIAAVGLGIGAAWLRKRI